MQCAMEEDDLFLARNLKTSFLLNSIKEFLILEETVSDGHKDNF